MISMMDSFGSHNVDFVMLLTNPALVMYPEMSWDTTVRYKKEPPQRTALIDGQKDVVLPDI